MFLLVFLRMLVKVVQKLMKHNVKKVAQIIYVIIIQKNIGVVLF